MAGSKARLMKPPRYQSKQDVNDELLDELPPGQDLEQKSLDLQQ